VRPTEKLRNELIEPMFAAIERSAGMQYRKLIRMRYADILAGLSSTSTHEKGLALEALAFYLGRLLGLEFVQWRLRSNKTGGVEAEAVMQGTHLSFSRWQVRCKNARHVTVEDVATEIGWSTYRKSSVILILTTGRLTSDARSFVTAAVQSTNFRIIALEQEDIATLIAHPESPSAPKALISAKFEHAHSHKGRSEPQLVWS
jgi:hypothetical protein